MILIITIYKEKFHHLEFVKPIEDVLRRENIPFKTVHYKDCKHEMLSMSEKIIISGTSLKDNDFLNYIEKFEWIIDYDKPILGICGGMHILGLIFRGKLIKYQEIGLTDVDFQEKIFEINGIRQEYELHNFYAQSNEFDIFAVSENCPQIIKHKDLPFYGVLFHPEVRNKELLSFFAKL
jgi:GMP synthase (glutamine-hydrolysing)